MLRFSLPDAKAQINVLVRYLVSSSYSSVEINSEGLAIPDLSEKTDWNHAVQFLAWKLCQTGKQRITVKVSGEVSVV